MSDNPYYRELVDFRQTLQDWVTGATPAADEDMTFARILVAAPDDGIYIRQDGQLIILTSSCVRFSYRAVANCQAAPARS